MIEGEKIFVVGPAWVGDMVFAQCLFVDLLRQSPGAEITVAAPAWSAPLLRRMPEVSQIVELPFRHGELCLAKRRQLGRSLRAQGFTRAIVLPRSLKSALLPWFADIPVRTGFLGELRYGLINDRRIFDPLALPGMVDRFMALGRPAGESAEKIPFRSPRLKIDESNRALCVQKFALSCQQPILALLPGAAFGRSKRWPARYFAKVAGHFAKQGRQVWILGGESETEAGSLIAARVPRATNLCGRTSLMDAVDLLSLCSLAIGNDSGLSHLATAVGCLPLVIYGSSSPAFTPPLHARAQILRLDLPCSPCGKRTCRYGHYRCLNDLQPEAVCATGEKMLSSHIAKMPKSAFAGNSVVVQSIS